MDSKHGVRRDNRYRSTRTPGHYLGTQREQVGEFSTFMDSLSRRVVGNKSVVTPIMAFVKKQVNKVAQEVRFEWALEY